MDDIRFVELQIEAVTNDMYRYLGWFPDEKEMLKKESVKAIDDLVLISQNSLPIEKVENRQTSILTLLLFSCWDNGDCPG